MTGLIKNMKRFMKRNWVKLTAAALSLCVALLPGCKKAGAEPAEESQIVLPTPEPEPQPVSGGELRLPMPANADIADPYVVNTEEMLSLYSLIYEGLIRLDGVGKLTASLAETWTADTSGKVWTINLRTSARWHDSGRQLSAEDVKYSYDRLAAMEGGSYYSALLSRVEKVDIIDSATVEITMKTKGISALYALTFPILPYTSTTLDLPEGTGPYRVSQAGSARIVLEANDNWWRLRPYIDTITFLARDSNDTALASYEAGQLDMVPTSLVSAGRYREEGTTAVIDIMTQSAELILINSTCESLKDIKARQAIACALDRSEIISNVYMNRAQACDVPVAPDSWIYDNTSKIYDYNTARAMTLLNELGWADVDNDDKLELNGRNYDEFFLTLLVNSSTDTVRLQAAQMAADQLGALGITVEIVSAEYVLGDSECEYMQLLKAGSFDIAMVGFNLGRDADLSSLVNRDGANNYGRFTNAYLESLAESMNTAEDEASYMAASHEMQQAIAAELPFITLYFRQNSIVYSTDIQGLTDVREPDIFRTVSRFTL